MQRVSEELRKRWRRTAVVPVVPRPLSGPYAPEAIHALLDDLADRDAALKVAREALGSARSVLMVVGDGRGELSAKASVAYSHASAALAQIDALTGKG